MKNGPVTIIDLARALNISPSTVSRALHDHPRISAKTRRAVQQLAAELNYRPNALALNLLSNRTHILGVILPRLAHSFFSAAISGIEDVALRTGYNVMFCQSNEQLMREQAATCALLASRVDGMLVSISRETDCGEHFEAVRRQGIPLVFFDRPFSGLEAPCVLVDDYGGAFRATEHLINQGCRRVAYLSGTDVLPISRERMRGYQAALRAYHLPLVADLVVDTNLEPARTQAQVRALMARPAPPDGLFAFNDYVALDALRTLHTLGLQVPGQVAVVGFSDDPLGTYVEPHLTTVAQPAYKMGAVATETLIQLIDGSHPVPATQVLPTELIVRASSVRMPAGRPPAVSSPAPGAAGRP